MFGVLLISLFTVLIPLSLCVVPSLARVTVFPCLTSLIYRFASTYVQPCLKVEVLFGAFEVSENAAGLRETLRGVSIALYFVKLQNAFMKTLAFAQQGVAPIALTGVSIKAIQLHLASTWRVLLEIEEMEVDAVMVDPTADGTFEMKDAVAMKLGEAAGWINKLVAQKTKDEQQQAVTSADPNAAPKGFSFKDRVVQLIMAQVELQIKSVKINVTSQLLVAAESASETEQSGLEVVSRKDQSLPTRLSISLKSFEIFSSVKHDNLEEALDLVLTSNDIRVQHKIRIKEFLIEAAKVDTDSDASKAKDDGMTKKSSGSLLSFPALELQLEVPPMARAMGIVENIAPIPLDKRVAHVQLIFSGTNSLSIPRELLVSVLGDLYVPYMNHQSLVKTVRFQEADATSQNALSADDVSFYVDNYGKIDTNKNLSATEKAERSAKILELEGKISLEKILKLRSQAIGLAKHFRSAQEELSLADYNAIVLENALKKENVMFKSMLIALRLENLSMSFAERGKQVAEMTFIEFGVNMTSYTIPSGEEKCTQDLDVNMEQLMFTVNKIASVGPAATSVTKLIYADFQPVIPNSDSLTPPQLLKVHLAQYLNGQQNIETTLSHLQIVTSTEVLEYFLKYIDRLSTETGQVLAGVRPPIVPEPEPVVSASTSDTVIASMAPFSVLGGKLLNFAVDVDDCHVLLMPTTAFTKSMSIQCGDAGLNTRMDLPLSLRIRVESTRSSENILVEASELGLIARYIEADDESEALLIPTSLVCQFSLEEDAADPLLCHEKISLQVPDVAFVFSDLSLALISSCSKALSSMQTSTPEQALLKEQARLKQVELTRQAELDAILARIRRIFDEIDVDKNGRIDIGELLVLLRRIRVGVNLLESELEYFARALFREIDHDANGYIEFDELREYMREDNSKMSSDFDGSGDLSGVLDLRGIEYHSNDVIGKLCDTSILNMTQFADLVEKPFVQARFWELYEAETLLKKDSFGSLSPVDLQKKLVRLVKNYEAAKILWEKLIIPTVKENEKLDAGVCDWLLQPFTRCGGVSEYSSAARMIAKKKRSGIFSAAVGENEHLIQIAQHPNPVKKKIDFTTDFLLGNLSLTLMDTDLPAQFCRGNFIIQDVKISLELNASEIDAYSPVDWTGLTTSGSCEWTALFGVNVVASCYSELAGEMENVVEPWELLAGLSSNYGENGLAVLMEAAKRFQINVTPSLLKTYRALMEVIDADVEPATFQKYQEDLQSALVVQSHRGSARGTECLIQNFTGCDLVLQLNGEDIQIKANSRAYTIGSAVVNGATNFHLLQISEWGSKESVSLPAFGCVNVPVISETNATLFVSAYCRFEDPQRQRLILKSNLYLSNQSTQHYEMKYLVHGCEGRAAKTADVCLRPNERVNLPVSLMMGMTEIYARPKGFDQWTVTSTLNDDLMTSAAAIQELHAFEDAMKESESQRRGGSIVYIENQETSSKVVNQVAPNVLLRRWHLRSHFEWELSVLPPFMVRNSLPYAMEFRFIEYKTTSSKNVNAEFAKIEEQLTSENDAVPGTVMCGNVESGQDAEIAGASCQYPGYMSVRLVTSKKEKVASSWSKPFLMAIHGSLKHFATSRESVMLKGGLQFSVDRMSLTNLPRLVRFSCRYWIVNSTSLKFDCASVSPGENAKSYTPMDQHDDFNCPILATLDHDRLSLKPAAVVGHRPKAWDLLGEIPETAYLESTITDDVIKNGSWSEAMNTTTINTIGEYTCGSSVFAMKIDALYGNFDNSIALTLSPRYFVQNRMKEDIWVQTFGCVETDPEKVDDLFHKRNPDDVKAFSICLQHGEASPAYHFGTLKKGESLAKCQKYISISFSEDWGGDSTEAWSFAIPVNAAADMYLQMYSPIRQRSLICQASVQVVGMYVYVIFSDVSSSPPYRIENYTPYTINCSQLGESSLFKGADKEYSAVVKSGEWHAFTWYNPLSKDRDVEIFLTHPEGKSKAKKYDIDFVGYHEPMKFDLATSKIRVEVVVEVVVDESTRVLKFLEKELEIIRLENQEAQLEDEFQQRKMMFASSFDIRIAGFGLSLIDGFPQEIFFASMDVLQVQKPPASLEWTYSIFHLQLDDMLTSAKFPVILNPINAGYSDRSVGKDPTPLLKLVVDADLAAKIGVYKLLDFQFCGLALKVDIDYLVSLVKLVEPFLVTDTVVANRSIRTLQTTLRSQVPPIPVLQLTADGNIQHDLLYINLLRIHALSIDLEYSITRKDIAGSGDGRSVILGFLTQIIGLVGSNLSGSPNFNFSEIVINRCFSTKQRLQSQLIQNFVRQAVLQAYRLVGSADIIGNPVGLVEDLGSGVVEFFKLTKGELTGESQTRGEGVKVLGKTIVKSGASTVAKITGSLDKLVGEFAEEDTQQNRENTGNDASGKDDSGGMKFAKDLGRGITGIFTKPVEGAMKGGLTGLVTGTVQGIAGPGVVLLKQITSTSHNLALGVQSTVVDRSPFGGRRRLPKKVENNKLVADFDIVHYKPTRMNLEVVGASALLSDSSCDPLCVVRIDSKTVLKTRVLYNTLNPVWQEKTQIEIDENDKEVQFVVKDSYGGTIDKTIGKCIVSMQQLQNDFKPPEHSSDLAEWVRSGVKPGDTTKNVSHQVREKEYPLLYSKSPSGGSALLRMGSSSAKPNTNHEENEYQILVTVGALRDLKLKSSSGGGVLGLGNLVSSTPNISPYFSMRVAKEKTRTNTAKMSFTKAAKGASVGRAEWNETFTFQVKKRDLDTEGLLLLSLKDKSMLHDETLGYVRKPLSSSIGNLSEELPVVEHRDGSGAVVGYVVVKIEVSSATVAVGADAADEMETSSSSEGAVAVPVPLPARASSMMLGGRKAGKIRVACEFV